MPSDRRPDRRSVVEDGKRQLQLVGRLAQGETLVERLAEYAPRALGQGLTIKPRERLRGAEAPAGAADKQDAGYRVPCHGSV